MGLAWQQGPLATGSVGHFLTPQPMPERILYAEPLRRRMRVKFGGRYIVDSEDVVLLHEPGRYPVAYFPRGDVQQGVLISEERVTQHRDLGDTRWFTVGVDGREANHAAWEYPALPDYAAVLDGRVAFAWRAMVALYESGFAPRWYVLRDDVDESALELVDGQTFCPYKGLASYYTIGTRKRAAWSYTNAWPEVARVSNLLSFEPDKVDVYLVDRQLHLEPGQSVIPHGVDRGLDTDEILQKTSA